MTTHDLTDRAELAERVTGRVADHEATMRAAARLATSRLLLPKITSYVEGDGWVDWSRFAGDLIAGLPWSSGEKRLARIACSLSGQLCYLDGLDLPELEAPRPRQVAELMSAWSLSECLYGLDDDVLSTVLDAIHISASGRPITCGPGSTGAAQPGSAPEAGGR